jgi:hypothetical protein
MYSLRAMIAKTNNVTLTVVRWSFELASKRANARNEVWQPILVKKSTYGPPFLSMLLGDVALVMRRPGAGGCRYGQPPELARLPRGGRLMSGLKGFLKRWLVDTRDLIWLLGIVMVTLAVTHISITMAADSLSNWN